MFFYKNFKVLIFINNKTTEIIAKAKNKKSAINMVEDVVKKCTLWSIRDSDYKIVCRRIRG